MVSLIEDNDISGPIELKKTETVHDLRNRKIVAEKKMEAKEKMDEENGDEKFEKSTDFFALGSDLYGVIVLMILYVLQGVPLGLASSVPILIQKNVKGYSEQAAFSIVTYPFSCKLLWAPLVDCFYCERFGRRKSWLVPLQFAIGGVMLYIPSVIEEALGTDGGGANVKVLALWFTFLTFLAATQDIAVDGWALSMLSKRNVGWASTCNSVGQTIGYFFGYLGFLALDSPMFCNLFRGESLDSGCVTMQGFLKFWGVIFITTTSLVAIFVREKETTEEEEDEGFVQTYLNMIKIVKLRNVIVYMGCVCIVKTCFSPVDSLTGLKLLEAGISKDMLVTLSAFLIPLQIVMPLVITKYTNSQFPLNTYTSAVYLRTLGVALITIFVFATFTMQTYNSTFYIIGLLIQVIYSAGASMMFVSCMMQSARVSDIKMGGTYITLLNTIINLGGTLPQTVSLFMVDRVTLSSCHGTLLDSPPSCYMDKDSCVAAGGNCVTDVDGYFVLVALGTLGALLWKWKMSKMMLQLQNRPVESWHVSGGK